MSQVKYKKGTFLVIPNKQELIGMKSSEQVVFFWICSFANENGLCFPSKKKLAEYSGISPRNVFNALEALIEKGLLKKKTRDHQSNEYQIMLKGAEEVNESNAPCAIGGMQGMPDPHAQVAKGGMHQLPPNCIHSELNPINSTTTKVVGRAPIPEIDEILNYLKDKLGTSQLDGSVKQNRNYAWLCLKKFGPAPPQACANTKKIIDLAFRDPFHSKNTTEIKYIYNNGMKIVASAKTKLKAKNIIV